MKMTEKKGEKMEKKGDYEIKCRSFDQFIDKNSLWRRTKKQILSEPKLVLPDYIKAL